MTRICSIPNCCKPHKSLGWCEAHYARFRQCGSPRAERPLRTSPGEIDSWLEANKNFTGKECLIWPFAKRSTGYGHFGRKEGVFQAHRKMCEFRLGPPPTIEHQAAHDCGNPSCVNPTHLFWKMPKENMADAIRHGTMRRGENAGPSKLTEQEVVKIKTLVRQGNHTQREISQMFKISFSNISLIVLEKTWKHVK